MSKGNSKVISGKMRSSITLKLIAMCIIPILFVSTILTILSVKTLRRTLETQIEKELKLVAESVSEIYDNVYKGDYKMGQGGRVYKGDTTISGNNKLIDGLNAQTGVHITMVYEGMRLVTTVRKDGSNEGPRINGTKIDEAVYARIIDGESFMVSGTELSGTKYFVYYKPLVNSDGSIIGAIESATYYDEIVTSTHAKIMESVVTSLVLGIFTIIIAFIIARHMAKAMKRTNDFIVKIKDGKLDAKPDNRVLSRRDEIGSIYASAVRLQSTLFNVVGDIRGASEKLIHSSAILKDVAQNTTTVVDEVVGVTEEITEKATIQSEGAKDVDDHVNLINTDITTISDDMDALVGNARKMADAELKSQQIVEELNKQSESTRLSLDSVSAQIDEMNNSVQSIQQAITIITEIADETDLLSLNASIEAARAGESGRGFAVVAEQIGKLALQSNKSAQNIGDIIHKVMEDATKTVRIMQDLADSMDLQQKKLDATMSQSLEVSKGVEKSIDGIEDIRKKVGSLGSSSDRIQGLVSALASISGETTDSAKEAADTVIGMQNNMAGLMESAEELAVIANQFSSILEVFKV